MSGRGRGRGRGRGLSINVDNLGIGRAELREVTTAAAVLPPPVYPPLQFPPASLCYNEDYDYIIDLKQTFRATMQASSYFIRPAVIKRDIQRYSDKYQNGLQDVNDLETDWSQFPAELNERPKRKALVTKIKPKVTKKIKTEGGKGVDDRLKALEEKEKEGTDEVDGDEEDEEKQEEGEEEEVYEEDEEELEDDYNMNYFDNGEGFGADEDDDLDEGPTY